MKILDKIKFILHKCKDSYDRAKCYEFGEYVEKNWPEALRLYRRAAQKQDARAIFRLGKWHLELNEIGSGINYFYHAALLYHHQAFNCLSRLATNRNLKAICALASLCEERKEWFLDENGKTEWDTAVEVLNASVANKTAELEATIGLGHIYKNTQGVTHKNMSLSCFYQAAKLGSKFGLNELVELGRTNGLASFFLAEMYHQGLGGLHRNLSKAAILYEKSIRLGYVQAYIVLARIYENDSVGLNNMGRACHYYALAAAHGEKDALILIEGLAQDGNYYAQYAMGRDYYGYKKDIALVIKWCMFAALQGYEPAHQFLLNLELDSKQCIQIANQYDLNDNDSGNNKKRALEFKAKAASLGDANIALELAQLYQIDQEDRPRAIDAAFDYYLQAAKLGHPDAWAPLQRLGEEVCSARQLKLSEAYNSLFNKKKASYWQRKSHSVSMSPLLKQMNVG